MTFDRRTFLRRTSIALAGGILVGDQALELFARLTHSRVFALGALPETASSIIERTLHYNVHMNKQMSIIAEKFAKDMFAMTMTSGKAETFTVQPPYELRNYDPVHLVTIARHPARGEVVGGPSA